jgi:adenylate cyclase
MKEEPGARRGLIRAAAAVRAKSAAAPPPVPTALPAPKRAAGEAETVEPIFFIAAERAVSLPAMPPPPREAPQAGPGEGPMRVSFPIRIKLVSIITITLFLSLGFITLLVWYLVRRDVEQTAVENNFNINHTAALAMETALDAVRGNVSLLFNYHAEPDAAIMEAFFQENQRVAAIILLNAGPSGEGAKPVWYSNESFFVSRELDPGRFAADVQNELLRGDLFRFDGTPALKNAAPLGKHIPLVLTGFPLPLKDSGPSYAAALFSSEDLIDSYGTGANTSFLISDQGAVLIHPDRDLIQKPHTLDSDPLIRRLLDGGAAVVESGFPNAAGVRFFAAAERIAGGKALAVTQIPLDVVFEGINNTTRRNVYLSLGAWFLGVLCVWFFAKAISEALAGLKRAAEAVEDGRYHLDLSVKSRDEIGTLAESMISMSHVLGNFEVFTNKVIARLARKGRLAAGGTDREATIFFSDIRSFTAISEKMPPEGVVEFLNDYMDRMVACVFLTGGVIDKFIGDAVMAHWGAVDPSGQGAAPSAGNAERDALNGVRAALMMRASLRSFNEGRGGDVRPLIKIGCGLNSGHVVAGQIGSEERLEYTVIGDTVSLADRTETFNKPFGTEILITEYTWRLAGKYLITEEMPAIREKGKKVRLFAVINMRDPRETQRLMKDLARIPKINLSLARQCAGFSGPRTLEELRALLAIPAPDLSAADLEGEEKKYQLNEPPGAKG